MLAAIQYADHETLVTAAKIIAALIVFHGIIWVVMR